MTVTVIGDNTGDDYSGTIDGEMWSHTSGEDTNDGSNTKFYCAEFGSTDWRVTALAFTGLSNIGSTEIVSSVSVGLYIHEQGFADHGIEFRRILRDWVEAEITANDWKTSNAWTSQNAQSDGNDRNATAFTSANLGTTTGVYAVITDTSGQLLADTQDFIDLDASNYGFLLQNSGTTRYYRFASSEGTDGTLPYISVTHAAPAGGNEPLFYHHQRMLSRCS